MKTPLKNSTRVSSALALGAVIALGGMLMGVEPAAAQQANSVQQPVSQQVVPVPRDADRDQIASADRQRLNWLGETKAQEQARVQRDMRQLQDAQQKLLQHW